MKAFIIFYSLVMSYTLCAQSTPPKAWQSIKTAGVSAELTTKKPSLFLIQNLTKTDLWLTHPVDKSGASAGWTSRLQAGNWSALLVDKKSFILNCIESRPGHEQQIPCEGAIALYRWKKVKIPTADKKGTFWAAEDSVSIAALTAALGARGFE